MGASKTPKDNGKSPAAAKSGDEKPKSGDEKLTPAQIKAAKAGGKKSSKPARPPKKGGKSSDAGGSGLVLPALAVVAAAVGVGVYLRSQPPPPPARRSTAAAATGGKAGGDGAALSEFELLQQGRQTDAAKMRPKCVDGAGCGAVDEEMCADPETRARCCRRCYQVACFDSEVACAEWADAGQCYLNPEYMQRECCFSCTPDPDNKCAIDFSRRPGVAPKTFDNSSRDLDTIFQRAIDTYPQYSPTVHSRDPWVVTFDNLLSDDETDGVIEAVGGPGEQYLKPSTTAKAERGPNGQVRLVDVPDKIRTSYNAWCQHRSCYAHPVHERVISRIMDIVGLPHNNAEHMQLLRYGPNEYYRLHHDWIPEQLDALCGPRAFTFFLYLSDVDEGGGTYFPYINITVKPKRGSAVWWPHGKPTNPRAKDDRTHHEAQPVIVGKKYAANYWIHGDDFKNAMASACDGRSGVKARAPPRLRPK